MIKMYNKVLKIIMKNKTPLFRVRNLDLAYLISLYIKNLCDNHIDDYTYENVNNQNYLEVIDKISKELGLRFTTIKIEIDIEKILKLIKDISLETLISDMFKNHEKELGIRLIDNNKKKVCYLQSYDFNSYDKYGNTTYIYFLRNDILAFILLDKLLGVNNQYENGKDYKISDDVEYVYINNAVTTNRLFELNSRNNEIVEILRKNIYAGRKVVIKTAYKTISFINRYLPLSSIKKIVLNSKYEKNESVLYFDYNRDKDKISLILYDEDKVDIPGLKKIVDDNKENKDNLIKITKDDLINNNYRIGFKLYTTDDQKEIAKTINEIVDANRRYMKEIDRMDYTISTEIDKLISK